MEDQNVIILLDKIKKLIDLGNKPTAISEIDGTIAVLQKNVNKDKIFEEIFTQYQLDSNDEVLRLKVNEIVRWLNNRFNF
jgi:hypothetical protein